MHSAGPAIDPRLPVLVGVGTCVRPAPVSEMMTAAAVAAGADAGPASLLGAVDRLAVPQGTWTVGEPAHAVATRIGAGAARTYRYEIGVSQQEIVNDALLAIRSGEAEVVLIVGGEARAFARHGGTEVDDPTTSPPDVTITRQPDFVAPIEQAAGIVVPPVQQYALIENALAAHEHQDVTSHRDDVARLWARFNAVAQANPLAAFPAPHTADDIATPGPRNRPLAYPYNLWHASQWTVDQAAAQPVLLDRARPPGRGGGGPLGLPPRGPARLTCHHADGPPGPARLAGYGGTGEGRCGASRCATGRPADRRGLLVLPRRRAGAAAGAGARSRGNAHPDRWDGLRRRPVQQLRPPVDGGRGAACCGPGLEHFGLVSTVSGMLSKPGLAVWSATPRRGTSGRASRRDLADEAAGHGHRRRWPTPSRPGAGHRGLLHGDLRRRRSAAPGPERRSWPTWPTAAEPPPPAMMQTLARCALSESLIGQTVHLENTTFTP